MAFTDHCQIFTEAEKTALRKGGAILRSCLEHLRPLVIPGVSTLELDRKAEEFIVSKGGRPAFKGYYGFPGTLCTSVNEEVVHGIPKANKVLRAGDIISLDCGVVFDDLYTDACISVGVGEIDPKHQRFLSFVSATLEEVVANVVKGGAHTGDISNFIETRLRKGGYAAVRTLTGHGLGTTLHQFPDVPNVGRAGTGPTLPVGTMVAIEPIAVIGRADVVTSEDGWTVLTSDQGYACHFEHSVLITEDGCEVVA
jgi:methionyl aminopeptidase